MSVDYSYCAPLGGQKVLIEVAEWTLSGQKVLIKGQKVLKNTQKQLLVS